VSFYTRAVRPVLFSLDAERAHDATMAIVASRLGQSVLAAGARHLVEPRLKRQLWGLDFTNPLGLAAGLDKQGRAVPAWDALGFGFVEIGTVTPRPQPGNPRPRLFRLPDQSAIINRFGFNSEGADRVAANLDTRRTSLRVGINVGRNKETPNEAAVTDYLQAIERLHGHGDYFVVNVSSPNTPGLRSLQQARDLRTLLEQIVAHVRHLNPTHPVPVLVKISPDETPAALLESVAAAMEGGAAGVIATNTTLSRAGVSGHPFAEQGGGLSGAPLRDPAHAVCRLLFNHFGSRVPIVGVGGIFTADDAYQRIRAGAALIQIYTALIYNGPAVVPRILRGLAQRLEHDGFKTISEAVGVDAR
jgi:dihydroorotate dehydrogenase